VAGERGLAGRDGSGDVGEGLDLLHQLVMEGGLEALAHIATLEDAVNHAQALQLGDEAF